MGLFSPKKPSLAVVFDVGSASVGVSVAEIFPGRKPTIIFSAREQMVFQENLKFERFVSSMQSALVKVARNLEHFTLPPHRGRTFAVFFASPWYASQTRVSKKTFPEPTLITDEVLHGIQKKEMEDFQAFEIPKLGKDTVMLETETVQVKLNGYETAVPKGKLTSTIQTAIYLSIAPKHIIQAVTKKISDMFHNRNISTHSFSFASFVVIRDIFSHQKSFFFLDISGEVTDVSLIRDNVLQETRTFPIGKNSLLRKIAAGLGSSHEEALSYFTMVEGNDLREGQQEKAVKTMEEAGKEWTSGFQNALDELTSNNEVFLPHDVFFTADPDMSKWFMERIEDHESHKLVLSEKTFIVRPLDSAFLASFCETAPGVDRDSFLMAEVLFLSKLME